MDKKEARSILLGRIIRLDDVFWAAAPADVKFRFHGLRDGAGDVFLFGVTHLTHCYQVTEEDNASIDLQAVETALYSMGRPIHLTSAPSEAACLYAPTWIAPVLLSMSRSKDEIRLSAYSAQSLLFGRLRCIIALWILKWRLPESITRLTKKPKPPKKAEKDAPSKAASSKKKAGASTRRKKKTSPRD